MSWSVAQKCCSWKDAPIEDLAICQVLGIAGSEVTGCDVGIAKDHWRQQAWRAASVIQNGILAQASFPNAEERPIELHVVNGMGRFFEIDHAFGKLHSALL